MTTKTEIITRNVDGRTYSVEVPTVDGPDGEAVRGDVAEAAVVAIAAAVARGPATPAAFKFIRKALGFTAVRLGELLAVRSETISRWENGAAEFDRGAWVALGALALERAGLPPLTMQRLEDLAAGKVPPKQIKVELRLGA